MTRQVTYLEAPVMVEDVAGEDGGIYECDQLIDFTGWYEVRMDHMRARVRLVRAERLGTDEVLTWHPPRQGVSGITSFVHKPPAVGSSATS